MQASKRSGGRDAALATSAQLWSAVAGIANQGVLAWLLAPSGRGAFAVCFLFASLLAVIFSLGCDRATQYQVISHRTTPGAGLASGLLVMAVLNAIAVVAGAFATNLPVPYFEKATSQQFLSSLPLIPLFSFSILLQLHVSGLRMFGTVLIAVTFQTTVTLLATIGLVGVLGLGVSGALYGVAAGAVTAILIYVLALWKRSEPLLEPPSMDCGRDILAYGFRYYAARLGAVVDPRLGILLLGMTADQETVGIYAAVSTLVLRTLVVPEGIDAALAPRIAADPKGRTTLVGQCLRVAAVAIAALMLVLVVADELVIGLLFSSAFLLGALVVPILAPGVVFQSAGIILMGFFRSTNRPSVCSIAVWVGMSVNVLVFTLLLPEGSMRAAAWGVSVGFLVRGAILMAVFVNTTGSGWREIVPRWSDLNLVWSQVLRRGAGSSS